MNAGLLFAVAAAVTWGLVYTIDQRILTTASPFALLFIDSVITTIIMLPFVFFDEEPIRSIFHSGQTLWYLIVLSIALAALANFFIYSGIKLIGASSAAVIEISYPFFVVLFGIFFFGVEPSVWFIIGGTLIFLGAAIISYFH